MNKNLVLSFNETSWELKSLGTESKVVETGGYPIRNELRMYDVYSVSKNGKNYKKIKVKISEVNEHLTNVNIYKNDEYLGNTSFNGKNIDLDAMVEITKWVKFYGENK